jgi:hypothetical protein
MISEELRYRADILAEQKIDGHWKEILIKLKSMPTFTSKSLESYKPIKYLQSHIKEGIKHVFTFAGILPC